MSAAPAGGGSNSGTAAADGGTAAAGSRGAPAEDPPNAPEAEDPPEAPESSVVSRRDSQTPLEKVLAVVSSIGPPVTVATALLVYFGWARSNAQAVAMGLDVSLFGYTAQDYSLRSIRSMFFPLVCILLLSLLWLAADTWLRRRLRPEHDHPVVARLPAAVVMAGAGVALASGVFAVFSPLRTFLLVPLLMAGLDALLAQGGQLALLGSGDAWLEDALRQRAAGSPESVSVTIGYDEHLAHQLFGGGDVVIVPSLFEPCGLTQMYGLKYGCLPLVRRVGGLADTVVDSSLEDMASGAATGFVFERFEADDYSRALHRAFALYQRPADWRRVRATAMRRPADWATAAAQYIEIYEQAIA